MEAGRFLKKGDCISCWSEDRTANSNFNLKLDLHYEDEHLAIVYKPAGIVVSGYQKRRLELVLPENLKPSPLSDALTQPRPVHRLDQATQGLVLVAKTASMHIALSKLFEERQIHKTYQAIVMGNPPKTGYFEATIDGKDAFTNYQLIRQVPSLRSQQLSLLELHPKTGRKHQLRIHLSAAGFPILGDKRYGPEGNTLLHQGLFLAACGLNFQHPASKEIIDISTPTPHKFIAQLQREEKRFYRFKGDDF